MKKNIATVVITLDEVGLKRIKSTPTFSNLFTKAQLIEMTVGENKLNVNHTVLGKLSNICFDDHIKVKKY